MARLVGREIEDAVRLERPLPDALQPLELALDSTAVVVGGLGADCTLL